MRLTNGWLTCARGYWLVVFWWKEGAGLDLSETVDRGSSGNPGLVLTLYLRANQIGNAAVY